MFHFARELARPASQPGFLLAAQHGTARIAQRLAGAREYGIRAAPGAGFGAGLRRAVLAVVEHVEARQPAPVVALEQWHVGETVAPHGRQAQRHVFVEGLVGSRAAGGEIRRQALVAQAGVVVAHLVVVPGHDPGRRVVGRLQVRIAPVLGVALAVVGQREGFVGAHRARGMAQLVGPPFINVVAQEGDQVGRCLRDVAVRGVAAEFPVLAGGHGQLQAARHVVAAGRRAGTADRADGVAQHEAVPVPAARGQALHVHVHAMRQLGRRYRRALRGDAAEGLVGGDFPAHRHGERRRAFLLQRVAQDARPQDDGIGQRRARGDPQAERVGAFGGSGAGRQRYARQRGGQARGIEQEQPAPARHYSCEISESSGGSWRGLRSGPVAT